VFSTKGRYALRAMIDIAKNQNDQYVTIKDISKREEISIKYLEQVISLMVKAGFLISLRGNNGGYRLSVDPKNITAGDILRAAEGTIAPVQCISMGRNVCPRKTECSTLPFWTGLNGVLNKYVDSYTLDDLVNQSTSYEADNYSI